MLVQTALLLLGGGAEDGDGGDGFDYSPEADADGDFDLDADGDGDFDDGGGHDASHADDGLRVFTVRGIVAFLAIGGWTGVALLRAGEVAALVGAVVAGAAALLFAAFLLKWALKLQSSGNLDIRNAVDRTATVYIPIPPRRADSGRVTMLLQGRFAELDAVTDSDTPLKTGESVQVVGVLGESCLIVVRES
jgi:membrane protein implicated in regulation of membrane protease activity